MPERNRRKIYVHDDIVLVHSNNGLRIYIFQSLIEKVITECHSSLHGAHLV